MPTSRGGQARFFILLAGLALSMMSVFAHDWRNTGRESANIAPLPAAEKDAVIQVYAAKVWGWRGLFADHTWLAVKMPHADSYTVYEVIGWRKHHGQSVLRIATDIPDRHWYGNRPRLLINVRGNKANRLATKVDAAARAYPYPNNYRAFPGPNSNTFTAWVAQQIPELNLRLPLRAVGKGFLPDAPPKNYAPSNINANLAADNAFKRATPNNSGVLESS